MDYKNKEDILKCTHEWKSTQLIYNTVTDCSKCHVKKEDWDNRLSKEKTLRDKWHYAPNTKAYGETKVDESNAEVTFSDLMHEELTSSDKYTDDEYYDWF